MFCMLKPSPISPVQKVTGNERVQAKNQLPTALQARSTLFATGGRPSRRSGSPFLSICGMRSAAAPQLRPSRRPLRGLKIQTSGSCVGAGNAVAAGFSAMNPEPSQRPAARSTFVHASEVRAEDSFRALLSEREKHDI